MGADPKRPTETIRSGVIEMTGNQIGGRSPEGGWIAERISSESSGYDIALRDRQPGIGVNCFEACGPAPHGAFLIPIGLVDREGGKTDHLQLGCRVEIGPIPLVLCSQMSNARYEVKHGAETKKERFFHFGLLVVVGKKCRVSTSGYCAVGEILRPFTVVSFEGRQKPQARGNCFPFS